MMEVADQLRGRRGSVAMDRTLSRVSVWPAVTSGTADQGRPPDPGARSIGLGEGTMKKVQLILGCLAVVGLTGCGGTDSPTRTGPADSAVASTPAGRASSTATSGPVVRATATVSADGLLFVGADAAKVGATVDIAVTNET